LTTFLLGLKAADLSEKALDQVNDMLARLNDKKSKKKIL